MKILSDWHFWTVLVMVLLAEIPQLQEIFPGQVIWKVLVILLGGAALFIRQYQSPPQA